MTDQDRIAELHALAIEARRNMTPAEIDAAANHARLIMECRAEMQKSSAPARVAS